MYLLLYDIMDNIIVKYECIFGESLEYLKEIIYYYTNRLLSW